MTTFDEREKRFESRFAHDAEARFKAEARRNKILGAWAAEKLGLEGDKADEYTRSVVRADLEEAGSEDVFRKLRGDLPNSITDEDIREKMQDAMETVMRETSGGSAS